MSASIRVGHVEVEDYWIAVDANSPLPQEEVIRISGMSPRDGTPVRCFREDGNAVIGDISPGETVIIGSRPPPVARTRKTAYCPNCQTSVALPPREGMGATCKSCSSEFNLLRVHELSVMWSRQMGSKRSYGSGPIGRKSTIHIPGIGVGEAVTAIEVSRHSRVNGAIHATGYRIRSDDCPYTPGDIGIVQSEGENKLLLFDPKTGRASVQVTILPNSLEATRRAESQLGKRHLWVVKIQSFDAKRRTAIASVDRPYTWRMSQSRYHRKITSEGVPIAP